MIHYVYKTTNLINNRYYIGKHTDVSFNEKYFGSGLAIKNAVTKYGKSNFKVEMLKEFLTEEEAYTYEKTLINEHLHDPKCYNLVDGGKGFSKNSAKRASDMAKQSGWLGFASMGKEKNKKISSKAGKRGVKINQQNKTGMFGMTFEQRSRWSKENNKNRVWITNGEIDLRIKKDEQIPTGFEYGRTQLSMESRKNIPCWTNGKNNVFSRECPGAEYSRGMSKETPTSKLPWWNNGVKNKRAISCPGDEYVKGRLKWKARTVICPHCDKEGGETAMKQHHFNNCKRKTNE